MNTSTHAMHDHNMTSSADDMQKMTSSNMAHSPEAHHHPSVHADDPAKRKEHLALFDLVPHAAATHKAVRDGSWFDPKTWEGGRIPGEGANVLISKGLNIRYDGESDASLKTVRLDGHLSFAHDQNTKLVVDTFVTDAGSMLEIGTKANPIQADKQARIIIDGSEPIDKKWDPTEISRGLITHGQVRIHGAEKADFLALAEDAQAGDSELVLKDAPTGWKVGDQLVLGGTSYNKNGSDEDNTRFRDEVLTITEISGNRVKFTNNDVANGDNTVLRFDHTRPEGFEKYDLNLYVGNTSRNVSVETADADNVPTKQRGHVMFMHNPDVEVHNAGFYELGRHDKNRIADDNGLMPDGTVGKGTNQRGRYALHFHKTGYDDINSTPSVATGNAVVGSPGWGIVHHSSHLVLEDNVVFDVVGSAIIAEGGGEIGAWRNNLTIKTTGDDDPMANFDGHQRTQRFDMGFNGEGYWVQGASQVIMQDNKAISAAGGGINIFSGVDQDEKAREVKEFAVKNLSPEMQQALRAQGVDNEYIDVKSLPLREFSGFEAYNSDFGIITWNHMRNQDGLGQFNAGGIRHDLRSKISDFKLWGIHGQGIFTQYTTQTDFENGLILGNPDDPVPLKNAINGNGRGHGISSNEVSQDITYKNLHVEGFARGIKVPTAGLAQTRRQDLPYLASTIENSTFVNNEVNITNQPSELAHQARPFSDHFRIVNTTFESDAPNQGPTPSFTSENVGAQKFMRFDASASVDQDASKALKNIVGNGIAAYGWDFDSDGEIDKYGMKANHQFDKTGNHDVTLTVWDSQGATQTLTQQVEVAPAEYPNLFKDGSFSSPDSLVTKLGLDPSAPNRGWVLSNMTLDQNMGDGGAAVLDRGSDRGKLTQVVFNDGVYKGKQTFSFDLKNTEGGRGDNRIVVTLFGTQQEFGYVTPQDGARPVEGIPLEQEILYQEIFKGDTFNWKTFSQEIDLGDGFQFIGFNISTTGTGSQKDFVAVDNVFLGGQEFPSDKLSPKPKEDPISDSDDDSGHQHGHDDMPDTPDTEHDGAPDTDGHDHGDMPDMSDGASGEMPDMGGHDHGDMPDMGDGASGEMPDMSDGASGEMPDMGDGASGEMPDMGGHDHGDMPDMGDGASGDGASGEMPDMGSGDSGDGASGEMPDMGSGDSGDGAPGEMPGMGGSDPGTGSAGDTPTDGSASGTGVALLDSAGATFNGTSDAMVVDHQAAFEAESGSFSFRFKPTDTNGFQALLSKDSSGYDDGGHLTVLMEGDSLRLRAQTEDKSFNIRGGKVSAGDWHELEVSWGPEGLQLSLDGAEVGRAEGFTDHLVNNLEPVVLGANQWGSSNQAADRLRHFFSGEIAEVTFTGDTVSAGMSAGEHDDMAQGGCPVTGEAVCHCDDKDEHEHESQGEATANPADDMSHTHGDDMAAGGCPVTGEAVCHCDDKDDQDEEQEGEADSSSPEPTDLDVVGEGHATADPADDMGNSPVEESLSDGNDVFNGDKTSQIIRGLGGNDRITAKAGDDKVYGDAGNDTLWGNRGHDTLKGGQGHDTLGGGDGDDVLIGVDASQMAAGRGEIDLLVGNKGADRFVIGDSTQVFYNDGVEGSMGRRDYAVIRDFNRAAGDVIQLHGQAEDYTLGSAPKGTRKGTGIFLNTTDKAELVAVVRNGAGLDLESEDFQFV
ncbi:MAG: hypothetical protein F6K19_30480 [Cyanothece sp. SIO1E1]|nr:hypothetical protein [Cyanothece sp. SIO1E1]